MEIDATYTFFINRIALDSLSTLNTDVHSFGYITRRFISGAYPFDWVGEKRIHRASIEALIHSKDRRKQLKTFGGTFGS